MKESSQFKLDHVEILKESVVKSYENLTSFV